MAHLFEYEVFKKILVNYGEVLPYPVYLHRGEEELVNTPSPVWLIRKLPGKSYWIMGQRSSNRLPGCISYTDRAWTDRRCTLCIAFPYAILCA